MLQIQRTIYFIFALVILLLSQPQLNTAHNIDSLLQMAEKQITSNPAKSIDLALKAQEIAIKNNLVDKEANSLFILGKSYQLSGQNDSALKYFNRAYQSYTSIKDQKGVARSLNKMGIIKRFFGIFDTALEFHHEALGIYQQNKDINGIASTLNYIGVVYRNLGNSQRALYYYTQALQAINQSDFHLTKSDILNNLASLYWYDGDYERALKYYNQSLEIREQFPENVDRMAGSLNNIGNVYREMNHLAEAIRYYTQSLELSRPIGDKNLISVTLKNIGIIYLNMNQLNKAEDYFKESLKISKAANLKRIIVENLNNLVKIYKLQNRYDLAINLQDQYYLIKDSILNEKVHKITADLQVQSESARKQREIQALKLEKQKHLQYFLIAIFILVLLLTLAFYQGYLNKSQTNKLLQQKNQEITEKNNSLNTLYLKLESSEQTYRYLFENNALPMFIFFEESRRIVSVNNSATNLYGYTSKEFTKLSLDDIQLSWDFKNESSMIKFMEKSITEEGISKHLKKNGTVFYAEVTSYPINFKGKKAFHVLVNDASDRLYAEMTIKESEGKFYNLFESIPDAILLINAQTGDITDANNAVTFLLNCQKEQLIGQRYESLQLPSVQEISNNIKKGKSGEFPSINEYLIQSFDNDVIPVEMSIQDYKVSHQTIQIVILRDIRKRKKLEEQLHQSQKLEAIGQLAGGIAHDFNNLLTIIRGYSELLLLKTNKNDEQYEKVRQIDIAAQRAEALTRQLLAFSRKQIQNINIIHLNEIIRDMKQMLPRLIGENIDLQTSLDEKIGHIKADRSQIEQIILNLIVNARDAMENGGKIVISTSEQLLNVGDIIPGRNESDRFIVLSVKDTGIGMDVDTKSRIFEPFFTTKEKHRGTGLGLSTAYGIIKQSKGYIAVDSIQGKGSEFKIYLPKVYEDQTRTEKKEKETKTLAGTETILVVEDEDEVRSIACKILKEHKYRVLEALDGEQALNLLKKGTETIDMVLTDVVMPKMGGKQLNDQLQKIKLGLPVLFMSGYTDGAIVQDGLINQDTDFIQKPFTPVALVSKIRNILNKSK